MSMCSISLIVLLDDFSAFVCSTRFTSIMLSSLLPLISQVSSRNEFVTVEFRLTFESAIVVSRAFTNVSLSSVFSCPPLGKSLIVDVS